MTLRKEYGDWQTPDSFALKVTQIIDKNYSLQPNCIFEPTCGKGAFVDAAMKTYPDCTDIIANEIRSEYVAELHNRFDDIPQINIWNKDFFIIEKYPLPEKGTILVIGNPPWVTNSELAALGSTNLPAKNNVHGLKGIEAITGASNFDICEYIILRLIEAYHTKNSVVAMLCKTSVARKLVENAFDQQIYGNYRMLDFDARAVFDISAAACLLICDFRNVQERREVECYAGNIDDRFDAHMPMEYTKGSLNRGIPEELRQMDGECEFTWRQGVKHDCSRVMELWQDGSAYSNAFGESIELEDTLVYPLLKSSELKKPLTDCTKRYVIMTQRNIGDPTEHIRIDAPMTWTYLESHADLLDGRKSSIYKGKPRYSMFGVGDYSYEPYKVAISGFYENPRASLVKGDKKPIMLDDTCYFIGFDDFKPAYALMVLLNTSKAQTFLQSIAFLDAKRPYTKKVLQRLSIIDLLDMTDFEELKATEVLLGLQPILDDSYLDSLKSIIRPNQFTLF